MRHASIYQAIKEENEEHSYPIQVLCKIGKISRASYYKWLKHKDTSNDILNQQICEKLEKLHKQYPEMGYRRLNDQLKRDEEIHVSDNRILRLCRNQQIRSCLKYRNDGCTRASKSPAYTADNILNKEFKSEHPNE